MQSTRTIKVSLPLSSTVPSDLINNIYRSLSAGAIVLALSFALVAPAQTRAKRDEFTKQLFKRGNFSRLLPMR
jgi:hypothetical protein